MDCDVGTGLGSLLGVHNSEMTEQNLTILRWALIASLAYMILLGEGGAVASPSHVLYIGLLLGSNLLIPRIPYRNPRKFGSILLGVDTIFVFLGVMLCDSTSQDLLIAYFLCIVMATFGDSQRRIVGASVLVSGVYSLWMFHNWDAVNRPALLVRLPFLFITTAFYGYMMQRVRGEHSRRLQAEERIRGLNALLEITRSFSSSLVTREVLERVAATIRSTLSVERCRIEMVREGGSEPISGAAAEALEERAPIIRSERGDAQQACAVLALPIVYGVEPLGVLLVEAERAGGPLQADEIEFCQIIANAAASALKNARQYEELVQADQAKSDFLSNLSHELRTPLSSIVGYSQVAAAQIDASSESELADMLGRISRSAATMTEQVDSLLRLSAATLGRERKEITRIDLPVLLEQALDKARGHAAHGAFDFALQIDPGIGEIYVDGEKLRRIVEHLLLNAVKFAAGGSVQVSAAIVEQGAAPQGVQLPRRLQPWERLLSLSVRDTGIGIASGEVGKVFADFYQSSRGYNREYGGLGIGLSIARRLTELLGGVIRVQSRLDEGSVFQIVLPVQTGAAS